MLNLNYFTNFIDKPTRVTSSSTVLDHILTNQNKYPVIAFVSSYCITDHYLVAPLINKLIFAQSLAKFICDNFNGDLSAKLDNFMPIVNLVNENNFDHTLNKFYSLLFFNNRYPSPSRKAISKTETYKERTLGNQTSANIYKKKRCKKHVTSWFAYR